MTEPNERPQSGVTPPAGKPSAPPAAPPPATGSVPIRRAPAPGTDRTRWEQDRAAARQLGRAIRRTNNGEGPVRRTLPPEPPHDEDLGISAVTAEFSADMVRRGAEKQALAAAARAAAAEADDPTLATLMLDKEQLRRAAGAAGRPRPGAAERRSRWGWVTASRRPQAAKAAPTRQPPAEQPTPPAPAAGSAQPDLAQPAAAPGAAGPATPAARSRREAEQALYQSVHDDHLFLNNPVLVRGLGLAPAIVAAVSGRTALLLCLAAALLIAGTRVLAVAFCRAFGQRQRPLVYLGAAAVVYIPVYCLLYAFFGGELAVLGIYLPLLVADPVVVKRMEAPELETVDEAWTRGINNALGQALALLLIGTLRELLAAGTVFGVTVLANAPLPLAGQPAGGFLLVGLLAAVWTAVGGAYVHYKREEVRMLYADRKQ